MAPTPKAPGFEDSAALPTKESANTYRLSPSLPYALELRRAVADQIALARRFITRLEPDTHEAVHESRRAIRRARAGLALIRPSLGAAYDDLRWPYRNAARLLSAARDSHSVIEVLNRVAPREPQALPEALEGVLQQRLARRRARLLTQDPPDFAAALRLLLRARRQLPAWTLAISYEALCTGLRMSYARAQRAMRAATALFDDVDIHRWRRRTRELALQIDLLRDLFPATADLAARRTRRLAQRLGRERELLLLLERLRSMRMPAALEPALAAFDTRIGAMRHELREQARIEGEKVFAEKPGAWIERFTAP